MVRIRNVLCVFFLGLWVFPVHSLALPKVERHALNCDNVFPCPPEIQRRVDFWIKVFRTWGTDQIVFHDTRYPERVYSVKTTKSSCRRRGAGRAVERERRRIRRQLQQVAAKLASGGKNWTRSEKSLLALFPGGSPRELRRAAKNIRCQQGNRDRFLEALKRYSAYRDFVVRVLRENGLSEDIQYLPFVESAYNPRAYSSAGAAGMWQIMPRTARTLGLQLNAVVDERFDPEAATWGAARYLANATRSLAGAARDKTGRNVSATQINPFVITSYNYGVAGMRRAIRKFGPDYITVLRKYKSRTFRTAVRNFYASFLAARYVAQNAEKYFGDFDSDGTLRYTAVSLTRPTSVTRVRKVFGVSKKKLKQLNPALTRYVWRGWRLIPEGYALHLPYRKNGYSSKVAKLNRLPAEQPQLSGRRYVVRRGDTACGIARIFNVKCRDLIRVNQLGRRAFIRVGQKLDIPGKPRRAKPIKVAKADKPAKPAKPAARPSPVASPTAVASIANGVPAAATEVSTPAVRPKAAVAVVARAGEERLIEPLTRELDTKVRVRQHNGVSLYTIRVQPEETLGHYADWLGLGYTRRLRRLNGMKHGSRLRIGNSLRLPISSVETKEDFENKRNEYHRTLVDEFRQHYDIVKLDVYTIKKGDSLWRVAKEYELPYWVLTRYNPDKLSPNIGDRIVVPSAKAKKPQKEPLAVERG